MAAYHDGFETRSDGERGEEACVAFAYGETGGDGAGGRGRADVVGEEGVDVVGDVVVEPKEESASFVGM